MLCNNRPEGFGPSSSLSSPLPTTCFVDVVLIPLPVWLYLTVLPVLFFFTLRSRRNYYNPTTSNLRAITRRSIPRLVVSIIYYLFIVANIMMVTLEIVRTSMLSYGIGLLPFAYVGLLVALGLHATNGIRNTLGEETWVGSNILLWVGSIAVNIVKLLGLVYAEDKGVYREGSKYPVEDQVVDVAVMAGVYLALMILEIVLFMWGMARRKSLMLVENVSDAEGMRLAAK